MITTVTLARGAVRMARRKVIVKHLAAIEDFGSMEILCSDKTGTLTTGEMRLYAYVDPQGRPADASAVPRLPQQRARDGDSQSTGRGDPGTCRARHRGVPEARRGPFRLRPAMPVGGGGGAWSAASSSPRARPSPSSPVAKRTRLTGPAAAGHRGPGTLPRDVRRAEPEGLPASRRGFSRGRRRRQRTGGTTSATWSWPDSWPSSIPPCPECRRHWRPSGAMGWA